MPNWADGHIKVRGKTEDIKKFLKEGLSAVPILTIHGETERKTEYREDKYDVTMISETTFYMNDSHRHFINNDCLEFFLDSYEEYGEIEIRDFRAAWAPNEKYFSKISQLYNLKMKIYTWESGMQFNQLIEVDKGKIIKNEREQFDDYFWDSTYGDMGG